MKSAMYWLLRGYKRWISPMLPHSCRFVPTCSEYALEAVELHGVWKGLGLAVGRLLRCQPFARSGYDPVPAPHRAAHDCCKTRQAASFAVTHEPLGRHY